MTFTIGEIAERSGFSTSALRYYERIGLVAPIARSEGGYRLYDDRTLDRLTFIERAKQVGCSLDDIADLVSIWDRDECGPVQKRFHELVTANLAAARRQIAELAGFADQLIAAANQLSAGALDGPCGPECACVASYTAVPSATSVSLSVQPDEAPVACTLDSGALPQRIEDWRSVLASATVRTTTTDGALRIEFGNGFDVARLATLVVEEQDCCSFFSFALTVDARGVALEVRVPAGADEVVAELFGRAA
jgi:MerR family transcriptional regulator, copper efflux regulator